MRLHKRDKARVRPEKPYRAIRYTVLDGMTLESGIVRVSRQRQAMERLGNTVELAKRQKTLTRKCEEAYGLTSLGLLYCNACHLDYARKQWRRACRKHETIPSRNTDGQAAVKINPLH